MFKLPGQLKGQKCSKPSQLCCNWGIHTAIACLRGGPLAPRLSGYVMFKDIPGGTVVTVSVTGLPPFRPAEGDQPQIGPHGFHLHEHGCCEVGDPSDPFLAAGSHWNPTNQPHGNHAGDFPALFSNHGRAQIQFCTDRFAVADILNRSVIIHESPDDYHTQPGGGSGRRLACGIIRPTRPLC